MNKGLEHLIEAVKKDCNQGQGCFNINGCDHEFSRIVKEEDPYLIKLGFTHKCILTSKCTHKYCNKLKWVIERAQQYADALGVSRDEVIDAWENKRDYWYMSYYQECMQPSLDGSIRVLKFADWQNELINRFGPNPDNWKFVCPVCGHVQSVADFKAIGKSPNFAYSCCIGRFTDNNDKTGVKGCNYAVNGSISLNTTTVISDRYLPVKVFELAPAPSKSPL